jgi:hypothetical protein
MMADMSYYKEWLLNCANGIVPGIEPAILARTPWGEYSAMDRLYEPLPLDERMKFVQAMKEIVGGGIEIPITAKMLMIDWAKTNSVSDIEPEVRVLDEALPKEPWDYDKLKPPPEDERLRIDLRGVVNMFLGRLERTRVA